MKEYFKNPEATEKFFYKDDGGNLWGCTGDIGYIDHEGFVYVLVVHIVLAERCGLSVYEVLDDIHQNCCSELNEDCIPAGYKICKSFPVKVSGKRDMKSIQEDRQGFVLPEKDSLISVEFC